ncbi:MAG: hypothetical protein JNK85_15810 [Verrucomicrobiales bacterium]|nr:hypothetical protein [Verrucomicrobiales bacterium]
MPFLSIHPRLRATRPRPWGRVAAPAIAAALLCAAPTRAAHIDILVYQRAGQVRLGGFDFSTSRVLEDARIFTTRMESVVGLNGAVYSSSPGWNSVRNNYQLMPEGASTLPGSSTIRFRLLPCGPRDLNLSYWNGRDTVSFDVVPDGEVLRYASDDSESSQVIADGGEMILAGFAVATTGVSGYLHRHLSFSLYGNDGMEDASSDGPSSGVYLLGLDVEVAGLQGPSNPIYLLLGHGVTAETLGRAEHSLASYLVPEPRSPVLLILGGLFLLRAHLPPERRRSRGAIRPRYQQIAIGVILISSTGHAAHSALFAHSDVVLIPEDGVLRVDRTIHVANVRENDVQGDGTQWATDNPGFAGSGFSFQDEIHFDISGPLRRWENDAWATHPAEPERMHFVNPGGLGGSAPSVTITPSTRFVPGFRISRANTRGTLHTHYTFILDATNGVVPAVGAYVFPLRLRSPQYRGTPVVHLVFNNGLPSDDFDRALGVLVAALELRLTTATTVAGTMRIRWFPWEGRSYHLESTFSPSGPWSSEPIPWPSANGPGELRISVDHPMRLFRLRYESPLFD